MSTWPITDFPNFKSFLGDLVIDPGVEEFRNLQNKCERGNGWRCYVARSISFCLPEAKNTFVDLDLVNHSGTLSLTYGEHRYTRALTAAEMSAATQFELGVSIAGPLYVRIDLNDGTWERIAKRGSPEGKPTGPRSKRRNGNAKPETKTRRAAVYAVVVKTQCV